MSKSPKEDRDVRRGKGYGFVSESGNIWMLRCFECGRENYAPNVASGTCAWCGFKPGAYEGKGESK